MYFHEEKFPYGKTMRRIREAKGMKQKHIVDKTFSRSSLSKFEQNKQTVYFKTFLKYLKKLNISFDEFMFIHNGYQVSLPEQLLTKFELVYSVYNYQDLILLQKEFSSYIKKNSDNWYVNVLNKYLKLLIQNMKKPSKNIDEKLQQLVHKTWYEINERDEWYLFDLKFLNLLIYYLPIKELKSACARVLKRLKDYKEYPNSEIMFSAFVVNLSLVLINHGLEKEAVKLLRKSLKKIKKTYRLDLILVAYLRIGEAEKDYDLISETLKNARELDGEELIHNMEIEILRKFPEYFWMNPDEFPNNFETNTEIDNFYKYNWFPLE